MEDKQIVCILGYRKGSEPHVNYTLYHQDDDSLIITRKVQNRDGRIIHISSPIVAQLDNLLSKFPDPVPLLMDVSGSGSPLEYENYSLKLSGKYGDKYYVDKWGALNFRLAGENFNYEKWLSLVEQLLSIFEGLTGNKNQLRPHIEEAIDIYHDTFHKKHNHNKYQGRWTKPKYQDQSYRRFFYYHTYFRSYFYQFVDEDISVNYLRQLDFRHYLPSFLWLIAFQDTLFRPPPIDPMKVFERIKETSVLEWDQDEQDALVNYFNAVWIYVLTYYPPLGMDAYTFIHGVQLTGFDVTPYIKHWKSLMDDISASRHLAGYVQNLYEHYIEDGIDVFETVPKILRRWLHEIAEGDYFLKRYMEYDGVRPFADEFAEASDVLSMLRGAGL